MECEVLLIGGRSGVGKSTVALEVSAQLRAAEVAHCLIEGDNLDHVYPAPPDDPSLTRVTETNLAALWRTYAALGQRRLIYTNTVSILEGDLVARAVGGTPRIIPVLLTADDTTASARLAGRELGSLLDAHVVRSARMALRLERSAPPSTIRVATGGRGVVEIAHEIVLATGWLAAPR
ncbi:MAG: adenylyl-sulfate kinase [Saccharothrix sp.]|nr:adenylyl-sulfate kinase [Saccharothrix sp.]